MMLARACRVAVSPTAASFLKAPVTAKPLVSRIQAARLFASDGRTSFTRSARRNDIFAERVSAPAGDAAFTVGKAAVAGGAVVGIGALCYYGLGLSSEMGAIDYAGLWPQYVRDRITSTYLYFGASVASSVASAALCLRSPAVMNLVMRQGPLAMVGTLVAMIGSGMLVQSLPYEKGINAKHIAWLIHTGIVGAVLAPLSILGGPLLIRAGWYTAGMVGGLSAVAVCAPSDKFLKMGGPLAIGLGVVFASSVGSMFLPPTTALGGGLHSMALYGGLILFSLLLMYDTQVIIKKAETHPQYYYGGQTRSFDPINSAISVYLDAVNIFVRIVTILAGGGNKRK